MPHFDQSGHILNQMFSLIDHNTTVSKCQRGTIHMDYNVDVTQMVSQSYTEWWPFYISGENRSKT